MDVGLLIIRIGLGVVLFPHGAQKLFRWFGGNGIRGTGEFFAGLGVPAPRLMATLAGLAEAGGAVLVAFGLLSPFGPTSVMALMLLAIALRHLPHGFWNKNGGFEFQLSLLVMAAGLAFTGPGRHSIDALLDWRGAGTAWGLIAVVASVLMASAVLASRALTKGRPGASSSSRSSRGAGAGR